MVVFWSPDTPLLHCLVDLDLVFEYYLVDIIKDCVKDTNLNFGLDFLNQRYRYNYDTKIKINAFDALQYTNLIKNLKNNGFKESLRTTLIREDAKIIFDHISSNIFFYVDSMDMKKSTNIIFKYSGSNKPTKKIILACQKELIENGFIGNARW
jgi:hypothetical protein